MSGSSHTHVSNLWNDGEIQGMSSLDRLIYRSNKLGSDPRITNTGGGNTSSKIIERDPQTGEEVEILWVKGSGGDLRTSDRSNFASLYLKKLIQLQRLYLKGYPKGPKTQIEDDMVGMYPQCTFNRNPRAASIDTPLHAFVPYQHVDHTHPHAAISVATAKNSEKLTREIYGDEVRWTPWQRPGFDLGLILQEICQRSPKVKGVVLGQHGLINWSDTDVGCYHCTLDLIEKAARYIASHDKGSLTFGGVKYPDLSHERRYQIYFQILPWLRGQVSGSKRMISTLQDDDRILRFVNSMDAQRLAALGTSCPDHFLRTKIKPLFVDWNPESCDVDSLKKLLSSGLESYRKDYETYYHRCKHTDSPEMRNANPTVILIPGLGMIAWGKNKSESRMTAEFFHCTVEVMRGSEAIDEYVALPEQEAFDIEYWLLEEAKLLRLPSEKELARKIILVIGAGDGVGKQTALRVSKEGAQTVCVDFHPDAARATAEEILQLHGMGLGLGGTGLSHCGTAIGIDADLSRPTGIQKLLQDVTLAYGGLDAVILAGNRFIPPPEPHQKSDTPQTVKSFDAPFLFEETFKLFREQNLIGNTVIITSPHAGDKPGVESLIKKLAEECPPTTRVHGVVPTRENQLSEFDLPEAISLLLSDQQPQHSGKMQSI